MESLVSNLRIKKGDTVEVIAGRERGKTGKVLRVANAKGRIVIEKLNMVKRHARPTQSNPQGGVIEKEASISYSNVLLLCPKCNRGVRTGVKTQDKKKVRSCKKCGETI